MQSSTTNQITTPGNQARALGELAGNAFPAPARGAHGVHEAGSS